MPNECVDEIICCMEQFKTRLLAHGSKIHKQNNHLIDQVIQLNKKYFQEKRIVEIDLFVIQLYIFLLKSTRKFDEIKNDFERWLNYMLTNREFVNMMLVN